MATYGVGAQLYGNGSRFARLSYAPAVPGQTDWNKNYGITPVSTTYYDMRSISTSTSAMLPRVQVVSDIRMLSRSDGYMLPRMTRVDDLRSISTSASVMLPQIGFTADMRMISTSSSSMLPVLSTIMLGVVDDDLLSYYGVSEVTTRYAVSDIRLLPP